MDDMTEAIKEAYASSPVGVAILATMELTHPAWDEPVRVVYDHQDLVAPVVVGGPDVTFKRCSFGLTPPKQGKDMPQLSIWVDNVSREIGQAMQAARGTRAVVKLTFREYLSDNTAAGPQYTLSGLAMKKVTITAHRVIGTCGFLDFLSKKVPRLKFTRAEYPGLVR